MYHLPNEQSMKPDQGTAMSNDKLIIPQKLRIGFNERSDTYTSKLAFVIYYDSKGKLRKETSFNNWIDKKIPVIETSNVPTSGFVLNKDVGGGGGRGWDHGRAEKIRIYDPRDFEFEITTANLLYILQECSSIKGKGLEGEFVYSWDGQDLILLPASSREYQSSLIHTLHQTKKVSSKSLVSGYTYSNKKQEKLVYIGKYTIRCDKEYTLYNDIGKQRYVFWKYDSDKQSPTNYDSYSCLSGIDTIAEQVSDTPPENYAEMLNFVTSKMSGEIEEITPIDIKSEIQKMIDERAARGGHYYSSFDIDLDALTGRYHGDANFYSLNDKIYSIKKWAIEVDVAENTKTGEKTKGFIDVAILDREYFLKNGVISNKSVENLIILDHEFHLKQYARYGYSCYRFDTDHQLPPKKNRYEEKSGYDYNYLTEGFKRIGLDKDMGNIPFVKENVIRLGIKFKNNDKKYTYRK